MKKIILLLAIALPLMACSGTSGTKVDDNGTLITSSSSSTSVQSFKTGDKIQLGDYVVQVNSILDPYIETNEYSKPENENKYVSIDVSYTNNTSDKTISYNVYDWKLFDGDGYSYTNAYTTKKPNLSSGDLNAGKLVRGWVTFEVPSESKNYTVQFQPNFLDNDNVEIKLY